MLYTFFQENRAEVLERARALLVPHGEGSAAIQGLPIFLDQLIELLRTKVGTIPPSQGDKVAVVKSAADRGAALYRLGVTLSEVVQSYGVLCDAITTMAAEGRLDIEAHEFNTLNTTLDDAIAEAVTEYARLGTAERDEKARLHLGALAHELRNALSGAMLALGVLKEGRVTIASSTGKLLERSLHRLTNLVDRSLADVRLQGDPQLQLEEFTLMALVNDVEVTASFAASANDTRLRLELQEPGLRIVADRQLLVSALSNVVLNGVKYTHRGGVVTVVCRTTSDDELLVIEVRDQCGGLAPDKIDSLFQPFVRGVTGTPGTGLGLHIAKRALEALGGGISVRNDPPVGCVFSLELPRAPAAA